VIWRNAFGISTDRSSPLSRWTTLGVGGPAEVLAFPSSVEQCSSLLADCAVEGTEWRVLGRGSNLLVDDAGVPGVVIHTRLLRWLRIGDDGRVRAGAGLQTSTLLAQTRQAGLGGLECLVGYPASVGGAARMNAGGKWGETGARIEEVVVVEAGGDVRTLSAAECAFGYRTSSLGRAVVAEVAFRLPEVDPRDYRARIEAIHSEKAAVQPLSQPSAGCMFRNPAPGVSAGRLIDECGLKGLTVGGAMVSPRHGNFVVNTGEATAEDVLRLVDQVRDAVSRRTGHELVLEVEVWRPGHVPAHP